jgi:uncharacterized protein involved in response to NO
MSGNETTTRGERMLALRKARMAAAPPILRGGFRPFFLLGAAWAFVALLIWLNVFFHGQSLPSAFTSLAWHRHEMLFGFVGAIIAGFLLTAIPNWTGRLPIAGLPLAALAALWLAARLAVFFSAQAGWILAAVLDVGFDLVFAFVAGREVVAARNRNLPAVGIVLLFGLADGVDYAGAAGLIADADVGVHAGIALVILLISLIGGRVVPSFTRNWMAKRGFKEGLPGQPTRYDQVAIAATAMAFIAWLGVPGAQATGILLAIAAALQLVRLARWRGWRATSDMLVLVLHVGYLWVPVGLALLAASVLGAAIPRTAALHAFTAGAMATMILAMMTRATLGHTGRELRADAATIAIYVLVTLGAIVRILVPLGLFGYATGLTAAGVLWGLAFALFVAAYGPIVFRARRQ